MSRNFNGKNSDYRTWMMHAHQSQPLDFWQYKCLTGLSVPQDQLQQPFQMPQH
jgi:hypothetical protein